MVKLSALSLLAASLLAGCTKPNNTTCADDYCQDETLPFCDKDGFLEGTPNTCVAVECTPNELVACHTASEAYYCNAAGNDINISPCANGCDEAMGGCINEVIIDDDCVANTVECDGNVVKRCNADGVLSVEACDVSCVADPEPHCAYLEPKYLPDICDTPATGHVDFGPFDTNIDSQCTGGIVTQTDGPEICVVRAGTIDVLSGVNAAVTGKRVLALIADQHLRVSGTLDVSANAQVSGPGGGIPLWEQGNGGDNFGGGGGGFQGSGGPGGNDVAIGGAANGGASRTTDPDSAFLAGQGQHPDIASKTTSGGAGGGALLIACRGVVEVDGMIDAGGGGGLGAIDIDNRAQTVTLGGGGGGGSGGHVVLQGLAVTILGELYANGGSGGTGGLVPTPITEPVQSADGRDGQRSSAAAVTPPPTGVRGAGGSGAAAGVGATAGGIGTSTVPNASGGGGGGAVGYLELFVPDGVTPAVTPTGISPALSPIQRASIR